MEIRTVKMASGVLRGPRRGKQEEMGPEARLSCVYILRGSESGRVPILPCLPPPTPSFPPSLPPSLCWPAPLRASQGRFLPQLGVLGCVAACLYWSVDFLVAACTYLNIPPAAALCSRPCTAFPPPPPPPIPPALSPPGSLCSLSHPLYALSLLHCGSTHHPFWLSIFSFFSLTLSFSFPFSLAHSVFLLLLLHLSRHALSSIAAFSHDSVSLALSPLTSS